MFKFNPGETYANTNPPQSQFSLIESRHNSSATSSYQRPVKTKRSVLNGKHCSVSNALSFPSLFWPSNLQSSPTTFTSLIPVSKTSGLSCKSNSSSEHRAKASGDGNRALTLPGSSRASFSEFSGSQTCTAECCAALFSGDGSLGRVVVNSKSSTLTSKESMEVKSIKSFERVGGVGSNPRPMCTVVTDNGDYNSGSSDKPCDIGIVERLMLTHPLWFLPSLARSGAVHLLQGKDEGNFIVRKASQRDTLALSVRLPPSKGPYIEHFLLESIEGNKLRLEGSDNHFMAVPLLVAHYCQCCDELPVQLTLPAAITVATTRQELTSLALLGQDYWVSALSTLSRSQGKKASTNQRQETPPKPSQRTDSLKTRPPPAIPAQGSVRECNPLPPAPPCPLPRTAQPKLSLPSLHTFFGPKEKPPPLITANDDALKTVAEAAPDTVHYSHSDVLDSSATYYSSSLADKVSDYEDIWAPFSVATLSTFKMIGTPATPELELEQEEVYGVKDPGSSRTVSVFVCDNNVEEKSGLDVGDEPLRGSSPFYSEPVDSLNTKDIKPLRTKPNRISLKEQLIRSSGASKVHPKQRFSDSNLCWSLLGKAGGDEEQAKVKSLEHNWKRSEGEGVVNEGFNLSAVDVTKDVIANSQVALVFEPTDNSRPVNRATAAKSKAEPFLPAPPPKPPRLFQLRGDSRTSNWPLDSSWEWLNESDYLMNDNSSDDEFYDCDETETPVFENNATASDTSADGCIREEERVLLRHQQKLKCESSRSKSRLRPKLDLCLSTIEDLIVERLPELKQSIVETVARDARTNRDSDEHTPSSVSHRTSEYDNISQEYNQFTTEDEEEVLGRCSETTSVTEFSEPWDTLQWEQLLGDKVADHRKDCGSGITIVSTLDLVNEAVLSNATLRSGSPNRRSRKGQRKNSSDGERSKQKPSQCFPFSNQFQSMKRRNSACGTVIKQCVFELKEDRTSTFSRTVDNFIQCTIESQEANPTIVTRNVRQFMIGIKNYLVKHGESNFAAVVKVESSKLKSTEFLNLDAILESALQKIVVKPLQQHIYKLLVLASATNGSLNQLGEGVKVVRSLSPIDIGIISPVEPPRGSSLELMKHYISRMQHAYSPLKKLENLLLAVAHICASVLGASGKGAKPSANRRSLSPGVEVIVPMIVFVLSSCGIIGADIECDYMWGLLPPSLLSGEAGFWLLTFSSAVKMLKRIPQTKGLNLNDLGDDETEAAFAWILIPDEQNGSITRHLVPVRASMPTRDLCKMIAHKFSITNPQDYGLYRVSCETRTEILLQESESYTSGQLLSVAPGVKTKHKVVYAYKRLDANIAWPQGISR